MVRTIPTLMSNRIHQLSPVVGAKSVVTAPSRSATIVLGVKSIRNALMILYQSVVGPIGPRGRVYLEQGKRSIEDLTQDAGVAFPQQLTRQGVPMARSSHVSSLNPRCPILSSHSSVMPTSIHWIPDSNSWKMWQGLVFPTPGIIRRCSQLTLQVPDML